MKVRVKLDKPILWRGGEDEMISKDFIFEHNPNDENDLGTQLAMIATSSTHAMMYKGVKKFSLEVVDEIQEG
jgi:hypothetical protein